MSGFSSRLSATPTEVIQIALRAAEAVLLYLNSIPVEAAGMQLRPSAMITD